MSFFNFRLISYAILLGLMFSASLSPAFSQESSSNERIVFLGDSITEAGVEPDGYVTLVRAAIEKKSASNTVEVIGAGVSGNKVPDLLARLDRDVLSKKPTLVVIYIGINDVWHWNRNLGTPKAEFESGLKELVKRITTAGARVILCTPTVIGEKTAGGNEMDPMLEEYSEISRKVATETKSAMVELRQAFLDELKIRNTENQSEGILTSDGVHLNPAGNLFVAKQMLAALGMGETDQGLVRHIVLFKFKDGLEQEKVQEVVRSFAMLPTKIATIAGFEMGQNISPENLAQGYTHCFVVTFATTADRDTYLTHPAHMEFVQLIDGKIDGVLVFDFLNGQ